MTVIRVYLSRMTFTQRFLRVPPVIEVGGRQVKRYHVNAADAEIRDGVLAAAYDFLPRMLPEPDGETPPGGWAVLHRGTGSAAYLSSYSWVWGNVVECRTAVAGLPVLGCPDENPENFTHLTRPWIGCVWELPPLGHERSAWVRHVLAPDTPDLAGYLADTLPEGRTGGPE